MEYRYICSYSQWRICFQEWHYSSSQAKCLNGIKVNIHIVNCGSSDYFPGGCAQYLSTCLTTPPETELEILVESKSEQFSIPKPPPRLSKLSKGKSWASRADGGKEVMLLSSGHTLESVLCDFWDYNGNLVSHLSLLNLVNFHLHTAN